MAGQTSQDVLKQTVDSFATRVTEYADGIASRLGQPLSGTQLSKDEVVERWNFSPLGSTQAADAQYHQLVASGMAPGQALDQVYPMRSMLYRGPDLKSAIETATQIQGWAAESSGQPVPELRQGSTLPMLMNLQRTGQMPGPNVPLGGSLPPTPAVGPALPPLPQGPQALPPPLPGPLS